MIGRWKFWLFWQTHIKIYDRAIKSVGRPIYPVRLSQIGRRRAFTFKASAHSFKTIYFAAFKIIFSLSLCTYITRMDVMLDFICMGPLDLPGVRWKRQNPKWKIHCPQWDSNPQSSDSKSDALPTELAGLGECCPFKWPYNIHVLPIPKYTLL